LKIVGTSPTVCSIYFSASEKNAFFKYLLFANCHLFFTERKIFLLKLAKAMKCRELTHLADFSILQQDNLKMIIEKKY